MQFNPIDAFGLIVIEIELKPEEVEGLILFGGHTDIVKGDFISVALIGGYVEFRYRPVFKQKVAFILWFASTKLFIAPCGRVNRNVLANHT